jgi:hypothetical protein
VILPSFHSSIAPAPAAPREPPAESFAAQVIKAQRKAKGEIVPDEPADPVARRILAAYRKARARG